jgi:tetratricopeptide (TPR) repeat protein
MDSLARTMAPFLRRLAWLVRLGGMTLLLILGSVRLDAATIPPQLIAPIRQGIEAILHRRYDDAQKLFHAMGQSEKEKEYAKFYEYFGQLIIDQMRMFENNDFQRDQEYKLAYKELDRILRLQHYAEKGSAWYQFRCAAVYGIDGLYNARKKAWWPALSNGFEAVLAIKKAVKIDPEFADALLGLGLYNYYRSVATLQIKYLPFFKDARPEGINQIKTALLKGQIVGDLAHLSLAFVYMAEGGNKRKIALINTEKLHKRYPENFIIRGLLGKIQRRLRNFDAALAEFQELAKLNPTDPTLNYQIGLTYFYQNSNLDAAVRFFTDFLKSDSLKSENAAELRSLAATYLGEIYRRRGDRAKALALFDDALKYDSSNKKAERDRDILRSQAK